MWLSRLSTAQLALLGDKILETISYQSIASKSSSSVSAIAGTLNVEEHISQLTKEFGKFRSNYYYFRNKNSPDQTRLCSKFRNRIMKHQKTFGNNVNKCTK